MPGEQDRLVSLFEEALPKEMVVTAPLAGLSLFRIDKSFPRVPYSYNSEVIILAQGSKRVFLGKQEYRYSPAEYLVLPVPLPAECEGRAEPGKPILGLTLAIDPLEIAQILEQMEGRHDETRTLPKGVYSAPLSEALRDATIRLLQALRTPQTSRVLAPLIKREILFWVLQGEKGEILQALAQRNRRFFQIARVLQKIHESCGQDVSMEELATELEMSSSTFYTSFKAVTDSSPLQYIKNVRLHKARTLMVQDGLNASLAAFRVGYESPSQFSREFKRLFGVSPARAVARHG